MGYPCNQGQECQILFNATRHIVTRIKSRQALFTVWGHSLLLQLTLLGSRAGLALVSTSTSVSLSPVQKGLWFHDLDAQAQRLCNHVHASGSQLGGGRVVEHGLRIP